jgi:hypothetical protein
MSVQMKAIALTSDEILQELITDSLPQVLGAACELISHRLPFEGNHLLCRDAEGQPTVVTWDGRDGGRALLAGLTAIAGLSENRGLLYRLYPALFAGGPRHTGPVSRGEEFRLVLLCAKAPPGASYLARAFPALTVHTFRVLEAGGEIGLLIDPPLCGAGPAGDDLTPSAPDPVFRGGDSDPPALTATEARYFDNP